MIHIRIMKWIIISNHIIQKQMMTIIIYIGYWTIYRKRSVNNHGSGMNEKISIDGYQL